MNIKMTTLYDSRDLGEFTEGKPQVIKAEFVDAHGVTYFGWKFIDDDEVHFTGHNHRFFQSCLPNGKKCQRKVTLEIKSQLLKLISDHVENNDVRSQWYYWKEKV